MSWIESESPLLMRIRHHRARASSGTPAIASTTCRQAAALSWERSRYSPPASSYDERGKGSLVRSSDRGIARPALRYDRCAGRAHLGGHVGEQEFEERSLPAEGGKDRVEGLRFGDGSSRPTRGGDRTQCQQPPIDLETSEAVEVDLHGVRVRSGDVPLGAEIAEGIEAAGALALVHPGKLGVVEPVDPDLGIGPGHGNHGSGHGSVRHKVRCEDDVIVLDPPLHHRDDGDSGKVLDDELAGQLGGRRIRPVTDHRRLWLERLGLETEGSEQPVHRDARAVGQEHAGMPSRSSVTSA